MNKGFNVFIEKPVCLTEHEIWLNVLESLGTKGYALRNESGEIGKAHEMPAAAAVIKEVMPL